MKIDTGNVLGSIFTKENAVKRVSEKSTINAVVIAVAAYVTFNHPEYKEVAEYVIMAVVGWMMVQSDGLHFMAKSKKPKSGGLLRARSSLRLGAYSGQEAFERHHGKGCNNSDDGCCGDD